MANKKSKITFGKGLKQELEKYAESVAKEIMMQFTDDMVSEYNSVIEQFYNEYTPLRYVRHEYRGMQPGLERTYERYFANPHHTTYYGGLLINSNNMYNDYEADSNHVLDTFLNGYHGPTYMGQYGIVGIRGSLEPLQMMYDYRKELIDNKIDDYTSVAISKARKNKYSYLKF